MKDDLERARNLICRALTDIEETPETNAIAELLHAVRVLDEYYKEFCLGFDIDDNLEEGTTYKKGINIEFYIEADLWHDVSLALRKIDQGPPPYILVDQEPKRAYNPEYGDERMCKRNWSFDEIFCENSEYHRSRLRVQVLHHNVTEYRCSVCGNEGEWQDKELPLDLDHINGDNKDNRIENLRFLCPNCHRQTDTWGNKTPD